MAMPRNILLPPHLVTVKQAVYSSRMLKVKILQSLKMLTHEKISLFWILLRIQLQLPEHSLCQCIP